MIKQHVGLGEKSYDILIGSGILQETGARIAALCGRFKPEDGIAVVTDSLVWGLHGAAFSASMAAAGLGFSPVVLEPGEQNKSLDGLGRLYSDFAAMRLKRGGLVVAFGGGVVGDLGGFAAATWMRGVCYIQVPTTLLAQVDSGVGGKTAIDLKEGKNLAGAFYQPACVLADTNLLATLSGRDFRCGMAEVVKYGAICSKTFFESLRERPGAAELPGIVDMCCGIKSGIVERDELDKGERRLLNFGHTFGHALETLGGFRRFNHGEAVAIGMLLAAETGEKMGLTEPGSAAAIRAVLEIHGFETVCPYPPEEMLPQMEMDKKNEGDQVQLVLIKAPGEAFVHSTDAAELRSLC
ncbi:MAG: 3-dehydroquinate synthase [Clostridiales Family XIII bacterium]|nr:3-dehydroquinate synthase [Clostridiales Family XIII bacterium]